MLKYYKAIVFIIVLSNLAWGKWANALEQTQDQKPELLDYFTVEGMTDSHKIILVLMISIVGLVYSKKTRKRIPRKRKKKSAKAEAQERPRLEKTKTGLVIPNPDKTGTRSIIINPGTPDRHNLTVTRTNIKKKKAS